MTSTQTLREDFEHVKAECARLTEVLRTSSPDGEASEAQLKARLVAEILKIRALEARLEQCDAAVASPQ